MRDRLIEREALSNPLGDPNEASRARAIAADAFLPLPVFADADESDDDGFGDDEFGDDGFGDDEFDSDDEFDDSEEY